MKILLCLLLLFSFSKNTLKAEVGNNPETKPESDISAGTKKILRKIGRKSMDETCKFTDDKEKCEKQKLEHKKANLADEEDTRRREAAKLAKEKNKEKKKKEEALKK